MSASSVATLVEMGASRRQAVRALERYKEVMEAAEAIFSGQICDATEEKAEVSKSGKMETTESVDSSEEGNEEEESCYDDISIHSEPDRHIDFDPYKGLEMSKDRRVTVVELEQTPAKVRVSLRGAQTDVEEMTQGQWMEGSAEGGEQSHLFGLYQGLMEEHPGCPSCKKTVNAKEGHLLFFFASLDKYLEYVTETVQMRCDHCQALYCSACHAAISSSATPKSKRNKGKDVAGAEEEVEIDNLLHCGELQAVIIGVGLAHVEKWLEQVVSPIEDTFTIGKGEPAKRAKTNAQANANVKASAGSSKGTGFAGDQSESFQWHAVQRAKQAKVDKTICDSLRLLRPYLPNVYRPTPVSSDFLPHVASIAHLRRRFLPIVSRMLQSDSLVDMSERFELYQEVVAEWFKAFATHEALIPLLAQPIMLARKVEFKMRKGKSRERHVTFEGSEGPRELAQSIVKQCKAFLDNLERHNEDVGRRGEAKEGTVSLSKEEEGWQAEQTQLQRFATSFIGDVAIIDRVLRSTKGDAFVDQLLGEGQESKIREGRTPSKGSRGGADGSVADGGLADMIAAYEVWVKSQCYAECDMRLELGKGSRLDSYDHVFEQDIRGTNASGNHKRGFTIAKELAGLRVSLPSLWNGSIFLRVDESRIDVLKACIVGPEGSPYQNGLFMFDIFLPATYNACSPSVKITTTANGTVRHNPNLYANGKVCLSLLGTWTGPGWRCGQSTLLQVLISIQSLVMGVEEPALNEPGWSSYAGQPSSTAYTKNCRRQTTAVAMLRHLTSPPHPWKHVIEGHFRLKAAAICEQLDQWVREDDRHPSYGDGTEVMMGRRAVSTTPAAGSSDTKFQKDVAAIKLHLQQHTG